MMSSGRLRRAPTCYADLAADPDGYDSALERELCHAPFFRENTLRLFRSAPLTNLRPTQTNAAADRTAPWTRGQAPYLLCRDWRPLMVLRVLREPGIGPRPQSGPTGLMDLTLQRGGSVETAVDIVRETAELILRDEDAAWEYSAAPVPERLWPDLVREGLVERTWQAGRLGWDVTASTQTAGLCWGRYFDDAGGLREGPFWSEFVRQRLEPAWTAGQGRQRSLERRLLNLDKGLYAAETVENFARTGLGTYLHSFSEELEELCEALGVDPATPYHQAAALIQERLQDNDERTRKEGVRLMRLLSYPLTK